MKKTPKLILLIVNGAALVGALIWLYYARDFEPLITSLSLVATLVSIILVKTKDTTNEADTPLIVNEVNIVNNGTDESEDKENSTDASNQLQRHKDLARILFIDDDTKFKIIKILNKVGWKTKIIKDVNNMDTDPVVNSHILFVDIDGVGLKLDFKDQGLGLAHSLKKKYPDKKVIIYSTESTGDRFHEALRSVDTFLSKNAEPFEFQQLIEQYCNEIDFE